MTAQVRDIIRELRLILSHLSQCVVSVQHDIKNINCSSNTNNPEAVTASVTRKIELLQECIAAVQRIANNLKACCTASSTIDDKQSKDEGQKSPENSF